MMNQRGVQMKAILFDLDGTLLPMDIEKFMKLYFYEMGNVFEGVLEREDLVNKIMAATKTMVLDTSERTNEAVFMEAYEQMIEEDLSFHRERLDQFYSTTYSKVQVSSQVSEPMVEAVGILKEKGYRILCVTNPLFPKGAILDRIRWAGLEPEVFDYITSFEENRYCKPQLKLYEEVLKMNGLKGEDCMMVGNDVQEDMIASQLGMTTYLVEDYMMHRTDDPYEVDHQGSAEEFLAFVKSL